MSGKLYFVEMMGGVALFDFDNYGWMDLLQSHSGSGHSTLIFFSSRLARCEKNQYSYPIKFFAHLSLKVAFTCLFQTIWIYFTLKYQMTNLNFQGKSELN